MRIAHYFLYVTIAAFELVSCKKSNPIPKAPPVNKGPDIYVAGTAKNLSNYNTVAVYWKNNVAHKLTDSLTISEAQDLFINDTDVYVAGARVVQGSYPFSATYWKNGTPVTMGYNDAATSIAVNANDVYVAFTGASAHGFDQPFYWKNGNVNPLTDGSAEASAMASLVNGSDIYVTGTSANNSSDDDNINASYWKNGVITKLLHNPFGPSIANAIAVQGTDVYIAGYVRAQDGYEAVYWNNGTLVKLATDPQDAQAFAIAVHGTDVYVAGRVNQKGIYWKNGVPTTLSNGTVSSIAISGSDIYFAGNDNGQACYWKNGVEVKLSPVKGYSDYSGSCKIIIVPH